MNTKGESIELTVVYYDDFINGADGNAVYKIESRRTTLAYLIGDSNKPYYKKSQLSRLKKTDLVDLWLSHEYGYNNDGYTKADLIADLENVTIAEHYDYLFKQNNWLSIKDYITHPNFVSRGYSQGDAVYIIDVGADYDVLNQRNSIDHILWDSPITLNLIINGDSEFYDLLNDYYNYDKNSIIENVNKLDISDYAKTWISENLPSEPRYVR